MVLKMENYKNLLCYLIPNILFFGILGGVIIWNPTFSINRNAVGETFLYLLPVYMVLYSFLIYKFVRKILLPVISFSVMIFLFYIITDYFTGAFSQMSYSTDVIMGIILIFLIFTVIPTAILLLLFFGLKLIFKKLNK